MSTSTPPPYVSAFQDGEIEDEDDEWGTDGFEDEDLDLALKRGRPVPGTHYS